MNVSVYIDDIEQTCEYKGLRFPGRFAVLAWMSEELRELTSKAEFDWALRHLDPVIQTTTGGEAYVLPDDFADNFTRGADTNGDFWCCKLDDGTNEKPIEYMSPVQYFSLDIRAAANGRPRSYTILTAANGQRELRLYPPPDANGTTGYYQVDGLYKPTSWTLDDQSQIPPFPANNQVLKYAVLRRIDPMYHAPYLEAIGLLMMSAAQQRRAQLVPVLGLYGRNQSTLMRTV